MEPLGEAVGGAPPGVHVEGIEGAQGGQAQGAAPGCIGIHVIEVGKVRGVERIREDAEGVGDDGVSVVDAPFFEGFSGAAREGADEGFAGAGGRFFMIGGRGPGGVGTSSGVEDGGGEGEQQERKGPGRVDLSEEFSR